jgi:carbonic anhydrase/acetyltransferase-like protein (isoleucine patch superfamily)
LIKSLNGKTPKIAESACISEFSYIIGDVEIGENCSVWPGAIIRADLGKITIGRNSHIEDNCTVHSGGDMTIGNNVIFGHGAAVHASAIGNDVLIGMNSTILQGARIESHVVIGAHTFIGKDVVVPTESLVVGVPAKIKKLTARSKPWAYRGENGYYYNLAREYIKHGF